MLRKAMCPYVTQFPYSSLQIFLCQIFSKPSKISSVKSNQILLFIEKPDSIFPASLSVPESPMLVRDLLCGRRESMVSNNVKRKKKVHESKMEQNVCCQ